MRSLEARRLLQCGEDLWRAISTTFVLPTSREVKENFGSVKCYANDLAVFMQSAEGKRDDHVTKNSEQRSPRPGNTRVGSRHLKPATSDWQREPNHATDARRRDDV
jgi:hypothetical protein